MCPGLKGHLAIFETDKILIKLIFHNILGLKGNKVVESNFILLSQMYSVTQCLESCDGNLKFKV